MFPCFTLIKVQPYTLCMHCEKLTPWGESLKKKSAKWTDPDKAELSQLMVHTFIMIQANRHILPLSQWLYGQDEPPACPCFCPAICPALWDMTNGVLCLKDCGVWCECSLGRGEVNYLGLNSYFVPLQGWSQQTGEESDASWTGCISRSLWGKKQQFFLFFFYPSSPALTLLCVSLISAYGLRVRLISSEP